MARTINLHAAKTHLSRLVEDAVNGEDIIIAKAGRPAVRLVPVTPTGRRTGFGADKGKISVSRDFDAPLPEYLLRAFGVK
ncbi:MAG: type II toxin-antitoxin system Phd/YefM family antitoxin [Acidobacteria bacterium]|nr:type II toxin-antitoxin system Phd/YefM family antitoxin [Acidobacteriota bacterium]